jgi:hypothetical protein
MFSKLSDTRMSEIVWLFGFRNARVVLMKLIRDRIDSHTRFWILFLR